MNQAGWHGPYLMAQNGYGVGTCDECRRRVPCVSVFRMYIDCRQLEHILCRKCWHKLQRAQPS